MKPVNKWCNMKQLISGVFLLALIAGGTACKTKPDCEYDHTGTLEVTNSDNRTSEVRLDGTKLFELQSGEMKEATLNSGEHTIRCFTSGADPAELQETISISDCETTEFEITY
jgi:hypothetical protein